MIDTFYKTSLILFLILMKATLQDSSTVIIDFKTREDISDWTILDDSVMGGISQGFFTLNNSGNALFSGIVRTENNGGFSSARFGFKTIDITNFKSIKLKVKGDGKVYQFRIKDDRSQRYSYIHSFKTTGKWETITINLDAFYPSFRGNKLDKPNFSANKLEEITFLIGNKIRESFSLEIEKIYLD